MATVTYTYTPSNGDVPNATNWMANFTVLKTLLETTKLDTANLSTPYAQFEMNFVHTGALASGSTHVFRKAVPVGQIWVPVQVDFSYTSGTGTPTFQFTDDGTSVQTSALTAAAAATNYTTTAFDVTSIAATSALVFTMTGAGGAAATDVYASVTFKVLLRS